MTVVYCKRLWQTEWSKQINNKLFEILPDLSASLPNFASTRKEETVLARLHIGHTCVTHNFLLKGEEPPWCFACDKTFSVRHFMSECADLVDLRERYLGSVPFNEVFKVFNGQNLFQFLQDVGLFYRI